MAVLALTNVYLDAEQKKALAKRAKLRGTNLSVEVRNAVESYLAGVTVDELQMLDAATRQAKQHIDEMNALLDASLKRSEAFFREIESLRNAELREDAPAAVRPPKVRPIHAARAARGPQGRK